MFIYREHKFAAFTPQFEKIDTLSAKDFDASSLASISNTPGLGNHNPGFRVR
jgi:hypothetical protein